MHIHPVSAGAAGPGRRSPLPVTNQRRAEQLRPAETNDANERDKTGKTRGKGVVRKLLEGHFRGVADVRLRINFQQELAAAEQQRGLEVIQEGAATLVSSVASELDTAADYESVTEDQLSGLRALVDELQPGIDESIAAAEDPQTALSDLRTVAQNFLAAVQDLLTPAPDASSVVESPETSGETPVTESPNPALTDSTPVTVVDTVEADGPTPVVTDTPPLLSDLQSLVDRVLGEIESALQDSLLPEPVAPAGNRGAAFEKFLAIYRSNRLSSSQPDVAPVTNDAAPDPSVPASEV